MKQVCQCLQKVPFMLGLESTAGCVCSSPPRGHLCSSCQAGNSFWKQEGFGLLPKWNVPYFHTWFWLFLKNKMPFGNWKKLTYSLGVGRVGKRLSKKDKVTLHRNNMIDSSWTMLEILTKNVVFRVNAIVSRQLNLNPFFLLFQFRHLKILAKRAILCSSSVWHLCFCYSQSIKNRALSIEYKNADFWMYLEKNPKQQATSCSKTNQQQKMAALVTE